MLLKQLGASRTCCYSIELPAMKRLPLHPFLQNTLNLPVSEQSDLVCLSGRGKPARGGGQRFLKPSALFFAQEL